MGTGTTTTKGDQETNPNITDTPEDKYYYLPTMFIPGTQKGGTSFLRVMLSQHPNVTGYDKEGHILETYATQDDQEDPSASMDTYPGSSTACEKASNGTEIVCACRIWHEYKSLFDQRVHWDGSNPPYSVRIDKTPAYLFRSDIVPTRLACAFPPTKLLFVLRDPSERAYSDYQMKLRAKERMGKVSEEIKPFMSIIKNERSVLQMVGIHPGQKLEEGYLAWTNLHNPDYMESHGFHTALLLSRGLYAIQLTHWIETLSALWDLKREELVKEYFLIIDNEEMKA